MNEEKTVVEEVLKETSEMAKEQAKEGRIGVAGAFMIVFAGVGVVYVGSKIVKGAKKGIEKLQEINEKKQADSTEDATNSEDNEEEK